MDNFSLVLFTVLAQTSVALFFYSAYRYAGQEQPLRKMWSLLPLIFIAVGAMASATHLGQPLRAFNALFGLGRSPISNEIAMMICYGLMTLLLAVAVMQQKLSWLRRIYLAGAGFGLLLIIAMTSVYWLETVDSWNHWTTASSFMLPVLVLFSVLLVADGLKPAIWAYVIVALMVVASVLQIYHVQSVDAELTSLYLYLQYGRIAALLLLAALVYWSVRSGTQTSKTSPIRAVSPLILVIAIGSELMGRSAFFSLLG